MFRIITNFSRVHTQILEKRATNVMCRQISNKVQEVKSLYTFPTDVEFCPPGDLSERDLQLLNETRKKLEEHNKSVLRIREYVSMRDRSVALMPSEVTTPTAQE